MSKTPIDIAWLRAAAQRGQKFASTDGSRERSIFWGGYLKALDDVESPSRPQTRLLRLAAHGLQIDIECREGLVVDLVVGAQKQQTTLFGRLRQNLANALRRAGDRCDTGNYNGALWVTEVQVLAQPGDDALPDLAHASIFQRIASHCADGKTHYQGLAVHEGVVDGVDHFLAHSGIVHGGRIGADDLHSVPLARLGDINDPRLPRLIAAANDGSGSAVDLVGMKVEQACTPPTPPTRAQRVATWLRERIVVWLAALAIAVLLGSAPVIEDGAQLIADDAAAAPGEVAHDDRVARAAP